jgi:hypothetical protein
MEAKVSALMSVANEALWKSVRLFSLTNVHIVATSLPSTTQNLAEHLLSSTIVTSELSVIAHLSSSAPLSRLVSSFQRSGLHQSVGSCEHSSKVHKWKPKLSGCKTPWKPNKTRRRLVMGSDVGLEESVCLSLCGLVGRISYHSLCKCSLSDWISDTWFPLIGYVSDLISLSHGWFGLLFNSLKDSQCILYTLWTISGCSLILKRWRISFHPATKSFILLHLWVLLPGLPL